MALLTYGQRLPHHPSPGRCGRDGTTEKKNTWNYHGELFTREQRLEVEKEL